MLVWRSVTASHYVERKALGLKPTSDQELINEHALVAPQMMVTLMRMNLLIRVIAKGTDALRRPIFVARSAELSWIRAVEIDFVRLCGLSTEFKGILTLQQWLVEVRGRPIFWHNLLKRISATPAANRIEKVQAKQRKASKVQVPGNVIHCSVCHAIQASISAKNIHEFREHGKRADARRYILADDFCRCCLKQFPSRHLLTRHLVEYTDTCLAAMRVCLTLISIEESETLDVHDIDVKKRHLTVTKNGRGARSVAVQYYGPNRIDFRPYFDSVADGTAI